MQSLPLRQTIAKWLAPSQRVEQVVPDPSPCGTLAYLGDDIGIVCAAIQPFQLGQIEFRGSWWMAACESNLLLMPKTHVRVIGFYSNTCIVEPLYPN
ncbi:MAG: NfeD family protein [Myxacorys californica WJT36-NPBG1]|jgi:membrane protein implicated in regulation of membrane protease activity|nr:NfeD family protein [Myxacorys californica WJT36-NPBG1]